MKATFWIWPHLSPSEIKIYVQNSCFWTPVTLLTASSFLTVCTSGSGAVADLVSSRVGGGGDGGGRSLRGRLSGHSPSVGRGHRLGVVVWRLPHLPVKAMTCWRGKMKTWTWENMIFLQLINILSIESNSWILWSNREFYQKRCQILSFNSRMDAAKILTDVSVAII